MSFRKYVTAKVTQAKATVYDIMLSVDEDDDDEEASEDSGQSEDI